jgi:hypothetical protein
MTTEQIIIDRIHQLPEYMHVQVIDYLDFLLTKYSLEIEMNDEDMEISDQHKTILMERYEKYKNTENIGDSWENVKQRLMEKYAV